MRYQTLRFLASYSPPDDERLNNFLRQISSLQNQERCTTKACDYIVSVWVDYPRYEVPVDHQKMTLQDLARDALRQLQRNHGITLWSRAPAALFEDSDCPLSWQPWHFRMSTGSCSIRDVYGSLVRPTEFSSSRPVKARGHWRRLEFSQSAGSDITHSMDSLVATDSIVFLKNVCSS